MHTLHSHARRTLVPLLLALLISTARAPADSTNNGTTSPPKDRPTVGMTKDDVRSYYGAPFTLMAIPHGERWYYRLKFGEVYGRAPVPFYFDSPNVRWGSIDFDRHGRVKSFDWRATPLR